MKRFIAITLMSALVLAIVPPAYAQKTDKQLKKEVKAKADKDSRKEAKKLEKQGWKALPGKMPIAKQIEAAKRAELDVNSEGEKRFFIGTHKGIGGNYTAAKQIADDRARLELAQSIYAVIAQKIEAQTANTDYGDGDIVVIDEFVTANKSIISAQLSGVTPVLEIYRELPKNQFEFQVILKADADKTLKAAKRALNAELKQKSEKLAADLDKILPY